MPTLILRSTAFLVFGFSPIASVCANDSYAIDQRDPKYQLAIEHVSNAANALTVATEELRRAEASHPLPGLDLIQMMSRIRPVEDTLRVLLVPEQKRQKFQTAEPDGIFFTPYPVGD